MLTLLVLGSGIFWTITYILIILKSARDRTYGMPLAADCGNIAWEFIFSFLRPSHAVQEGINLVWFALDIVIMIQIFLYGPREFADLPKRVFYAMFGLVLGTFFCLDFFIAVEFDYIGKIYTSFGLTMMMSMLFIGMLYHRKSLRGQSLSIALCKMLGTASASLAFCFYQPDFQKSVLLPFFCIAILIYDMIYVGMVYARCHSDERKDSEVHLPNAILFKKN